MSFLVGVHVLIAGKLEVKMVRHYRESVKKAMKE